MHTNSLPILNQLGSIFYPDDRWQAIFTSDDCSMGHQSANCGHQVTRPFMDTKQKGVQLGSVKELTKI